MSSSPFQQLRNLQTQLYEQAYKEAHSIVAGVSKSILKYSGKFESSLPRNFSQSSISEIIDAVASQNITLFGDFHTLRQSQRGFLRIVREYCQSRETSDIIIALELFKVSDQSAVDQYMRSEIDDSTLLEKINYLSDWGFPWTNFKMILDYAKSLKIRVIGINSPDAGRDTLSNRDRLAAEILIHTRQQYPNHKIFCLIGEFHLADEHLPSALRKAASRNRVSRDHVRILCNIDQYYFKTDRTDPIHNTEYLRLGKNHFSIINTPPWIKWHSFALWEETRHTGVSDITQIGTETLDERDDSYDLDYQFYTFIKNISTFLRVGLDNEDLENFHIYYTQDVRTLADALKISGTQNPETNQIIERALLEGVYFIPQTKQVLLTNLSINNLAEGAGQYLHAAMTRFSEIDADPVNRFYLRIYKSALGMVGSKILNPRRKCLMLDHYQAMLKRYAKRRLFGHARVRRDLGRALVKHHNWIIKQLDNDEPKFSHFPTNTIVMEASSNFELSTEIGRMLGHALYTSVMTGQKGPEALTKCFLVKSEDFKKVWQTICDWYHLLAED